MSEQLSSHHLSDQESHETHSQTRETTMYQAEKVIVEIPEIPAELLNTYKKFDEEKKYFFFCGDDRPLTIESAWNLSKTEETFSSPKHAIRGYGGAVGSARTVSVAIMANSSEETQKILRPYRGNFVNWTKTVAENVAKKSNLVPGIHSAESNEGNPEKFNPDSDKGLGCAYAANAEAVTGINTSPEIVAFAEEVIHRLGSSPWHLNEIVEANKAVKDLFSFEGEQSFNMTRKDATDLHLPTAVLAGNHAHVEDARIVFNLTDNLVSDPEEALEIGMPAYNVDVVIECAAILKAYPELEPRLLLEAKILDACATAEALADHDGKHAWDFQFERIGNFEDAVSILEEVKKEAKKQQ